MPSVLPVRRESVAFTVIVMLAVIVGALLVVPSLLMSGAPGVTFLAALLAALPVGPVVATYLWVDRYEPEPKRLLVYGLLWGAFAATVASFVLELAGTGLLGLTEVGAATVVAPVAEEATKGLFLLLVLWLRRSQLDGVLDGIVYAGMVGVGFAFVENIGYLAMAYAGSGEGSGGGLAGMGFLFVLRCLLAPFAHPLFTAFTGIGIGLSVTSRDTAVRWLAPLGGYVTAVAAHATWNACSALGLQGWAEAYLVVMVPVFVSLTALLVWLRRGERSLLTTALLDAAGRGLIQASDVGWVVDLRARRAARQHALAAGGPGAAKAMLDFQQAAIHLGFLHHRVLQGNPPPDWQVRGQDAVARIQGTRPWFSFPAPNPVAPG